MRAVCLALLSHAAEGSSALHFSSGRPPADALPLPPGANRHSVRGPLPSQAGAEPPLHRTCPRPTPCLPGSPRRLLVVLGKPQGGWLGSSPVLWPWGLCGKSVAPDTATKTVGNRGLAPRRAFAYTGLCVEIAMHNFQTSEPARVTKVGPWEDAAPARPSGSKAKCSCRGWGTEGRRGAALPSPECAPLLLPVPRSCRDAAGSPAPGPVRWLCVRLGALTCLPPGGPAPLSSLQGHCLVGCGCFAPYSPPTNCSLRLSSRLLFSSY